MPEETRPIHATIKLTLFVNGQLEVQCPIENKVLCLGLMEQAKHIILNHGQKTSPIALADFPFKIKME